MNILFLTLGRFDSIQDRGIYSDLMRHLKNKGHNVYIVTPTERRNRQHSSLINEDRCQILKVRTLNIQKTNSIEKGVATLLIEYQYKKAIKKFFKHVKFDLIIYSTPPITFTNIIEEIKRKHNAKSYLLLKDIFPQNAVDLGMLKKDSFLHRFFRKKEIKLYSISDKIGCMSPANLNYLQEHNPNIDIKRIHVNPNTIELSSLITLSDNEKTALKNRYKIPQNATIFIYGGNLGKPQGVSFLLEIIEVYKENKNAFFLIIGSGTEYKTISEWHTCNNSLNVLLIPSLPKVEFEKFLLISDIGLIFLSHLFTIPNFPSRLLSYLEYSLPIISATDTCTDIGRIAENNNFGYWCKSGDIESAKNLIDKLINEKNLRSFMGKNGRLYLERYYNVEVSYNLIFE